MKNTKKYISTILVLSTIWGLTGCTTTLEKQVNINNEIEMSRLYSFMNKEIAIPFYATSFEKDMLLRKAIREIPFWERLAYSDFKFTSAVKKDEIKNNVSLENRTETESEAVIKKAESLSQSSKPQRTDFEFINQGNFGYDTLIAEQQQYDLIPDNIMTTLKNAGWNFYLVNYDLGDYMISSDMKFHISGLTSKRDGNKKIEIRGNDGEGIYKSTVHEVGHAVDYELGWISNQKEFVNIFYNERNSYANNISSNNHHTKDSSEYFADAFKNTIKNPQQMKTYVPSTYTFINKIINNFGIANETLIEPTYTFTESGEKVPTKNTSNTTTPVPETTEKVYTFDASGNCHEVQ